MNYLSQFLSIRRLVIGSIFLTLGGVGISPAMAQLATFKNEISHLNSPPDAALSQDLSFAHGKSIFRARDAFLGIGKSQKTLSVMGPGRLFRRIDSSPVTIRVPKVKKSPLKGNNVTLQLQLDMGRISAKAGKFGKHWKVRNIKGGKTYTGRGPKPSFSLKPGNVYKVTLNVGQATYTKNITVNKSRNKRRVEVIKPNFGLIAAKSNHYGDYLSKEMVWEIRKTSNSKLFKASSGRSVDALVPVGSYKVNLRLGKVKAAKKVNVKANQQVNAVMNMPTAKVKLSAWNGKSLVGDRDTTLELYFGDKTVGRNRVFRKVKKHASSTVAPGTYTAVLRARNKSCKRTFLVSAGSNKEYKLNLKSGYCV